MLQSTSIKVPDIAFGAGTLGSLSSSACNHEGPFLIRHRVTGDSRNSIGLVLPAAGTAVVKVMTLSLTVGAVAVLIEVSTMCSVQAQSITLLQVAVAVLALAAGALVLAQLTLISV